MPLPHIVVTMGDPSGIGPEVVARALADPEVHRLARLTVIGDGPLLRRWAVAPSEVPVLETVPTPLPRYPVGVVSVESARAAHSWIEHAARMCLAREADDMVTAPANKEAFQLAGIGGPGPHASDNGLIGREEIEEIAPAIADARAGGIDASGPHPADSVFNRAIVGRYDVVVVMYHDQGHIAIKVHGFEQSVSVNLGLPFIRTSVDHGTAFDIAGQGIADETSMVEAIRLAASLASGSRLA